MLPRFLLHRSGCRKLQITPDSKGQDLVLPASPELMVEQPAQGLGTREDKLSEMVEFDQKQLFQLMN